MAMSLQERRKKDRERKATERAQMEALGIPPADALHRAIVEAVAFALAGVNIGRLPGDKPRRAIDMDVVVWTALRILCVRGEFDLKETRAALLQALAAREEHRWPSHVPSLTAPAGTVDPLVGMMATLDVSEAAA